LRGLSNSTLVEEAARKALSASEVEKTVERFRSLCRDRSASGQDLEATAELLRNAGYKQELMHLVREALKAPNGNAYVGALWIRRLVGSKLWDHHYPEGLDALCQAGDAGQEAVIEFLRMAGARRRSSLVSRAVGTHNSWLRKHAQGWAVAGQALVQCRCYGKAVRWMSGWREHQNLDSATLHCLALALRATGKARKSDEVVRLALETPGTAEAFPIFKLWAEQDQAFAGETQTASTTFKAIDPTGWEDDSLALYYLVRGVIRVQKSSSDSRRETFLSARARVDELFRRPRLHKRDVFLRREYRRCIFRMARDAGAWSATIPAAWRSAETPWLLLPLLAVPGLQLLLPCYLYRLCTHRRGALK